jgi:glycerol-3-phosphate O-acyltransferase
VIRLSKLWTRRLQLPEFTPYAPKPGDPAIFRFNGQRESIIHEVVVRVVSEIAKDPDVLEQTLNDTAIQERRRLLAQNDDEAKDGLPFWDRVYRRLAKMEESEKRHMLHEITARMAKDIAGNFDPRVYRASRGVVPKVLTGLMNPSSLANEAQGMEATIDRLLSTEGATEKLRVLSQKGTLVFMPTHSSNLDSVVLGYALLKNRLPPLVYGAGRNLFTNPIVSFFMHNLGAYRVDRRVTASLYKTVLKTYAGVMIERGFHSLFFPGGTRSRSNMLESHLKLGLAGSGVEAFSRSHVFGPKTRVWFVPATLNYELVLEAETLIEDYLKDTGKARFIIDDDEFSRVDRWVAFFRKLLTLESACVVRFSEPVDPFGNSVDDEGNSLTPSGDPIDPATYVMRHGIPVIDADRDRAYTRDLGEVITKRYRENTVIMGAPLVAHALYRRFVRATPGMDLFSRMRERGTVTLPMNEVGNDVGMLRDALLELERRGGVHVSEELRHARPQDLIHRALVTWEGYHSRIAARLGQGSGTSHGASGGNRRGIVIEDPALIFYYQNRLVPYAEAITDDAGRATAREIVHQQMR